MSVKFYANVPISQPTNNNFSTKSPMGGFGFDQNQGLFIPLYDAVDLIQQPSSPVSPVTPQK
jgi:hypothetical protein